MKRIALFLCAAALLMAACDKEDPKPDPNGDDNDYTPTYPSAAEVIYDAVTDIDGNHYDAVQIGEQIWMAANLRTTRYANGDAIPLGSVSNTFPCRYSVPQTDNIYFGYLYNWYAVMQGETSSAANPSGVQGICPDGWHVPSDAEWAQLMEFCSTQADYVCSGPAATIAKALAAGYGWQSSDAECAVGNDLSFNNNTGFSALPAGFFPGTENSFGVYASFWSATEAEDVVNCACDFNLRYDQATPFRDAHHTYGALSVRCVKD
jgi:uncharacterized protein (TIGR02145 family)